eukprot:CAMPEP_0179490544 /NCGR_PEP_ID=MMETSP0799-20121207/65517_1 /TAXON_ID=46947 /ORGANISM="Geminigera cryophila, Strain CCMP2564" /LENGTH=308 /DNA_ID=CAMNT_0021306747 /DNA_START=72 /DNA_END=995 /DNA_ORIENTATION=+
MLEKGGKEYMNETEGENPHAEQGFLTANPQEVVLKVKLPVKKGLLETHRKQDKPLKMLKAANGAKKMQDFVEKECKLEGVKGTWEVSGGRGGEGAQSGEVYLDVLLRRSAGFEVRRSLHSKIRQAVDTTKRRTFLLGLAASVRSGVCKVLYNGDPGKSAAATCSISSEIEVSSQMLEKKMHKLDTKMMMMAEQIKRNDSSYQKHFRDIHKKLDLMSQESTEMFARAAATADVTHTAQTATLAAMQEIIKELFEQKVDTLKVVVEEGFLAHTEGKELQLSAVKALGDSASKQNENLTAQLSKITLSHPP